MVRRRRMLAAAVVALAGAGAAAATTAATPPGANGMLVWQQETRHAPPDLWIANPDGSGARTVFASPAAERDGAWSPATASLVAFARGIDEPFSEELYAGDITTGTVRRLTRGRSAALA